MPAARSSMTASRAWSRFGASTSMRNSPPHMLYVRNADQPGFIGSFGSLLGDSGREHRPTFSLVATRREGTRSASSAIDQPAGKDVLDKIEAAAAGQRARR